MRSRNRFSEEFFSAHGVKETHELDPSSPLLPDPITETPVADTIQTDDPATTTPVTLVEETTELAPTIRPPDTYSQNVNVYHSDPPPYYNVDLSEYNGYYGDPDGQIPEDTDGFLGGGGSGGGSGGGKNLDEITDEAENGSPTSDKKRILWMVLVGIALVVAYKYFRKNN